MNNELIIKIQNLPNELIILIKEYTSKHAFIFTNRENYKLYKSVASGYRNVEQSSKYKLQVSRLVY